MRKGFKVKKTRSASSSKQTKDCFINNFGEPIALKNPNKFWNGEDFGVFNDCVKTFYNGTLKADVFLVNSIYYWLKESCNSPNTLTAYKNAISKWLAYIQTTSKQKTLRPTLTTISNSTQQEIKSYLEYLQHSGQAPRSVWLNCSVLRSFFKWLQDYDFILKNPITKRIIKKVKVDQNAIKKGTGFRHHLTIEEAQKIYTWSQSKRCHPIIGLSICLQMICGLRSEEVANLKLQNLLKNNTEPWELIVNGKGNKTRKITIEPKAQIAIIRYLKHARRQETKKGPFLKNPKSKHYTPRQIQNWAKLASEEINRKEEISSHDLRRTAATLAYQNGSSLEAIQYFLGHSSPLTTMACYINTIPKLKNGTGL